MEREEDGFKGRTESQVTLVFVLSHWAEAISGDLLWRRRDVEEQMGKSERKHWLEMPIRSINRVGQLHRRVL